MTIATRQTQSQRQTLGIRQLQAIALLHLTNEGLAEELARRAAGNPLLRLRLPALNVDAEPAATDGGLYDHILAQLGLILPVPADRPLAMVLVEALDANGWLDRPLAQIAAQSGIALHRAEAVLARLQEGIEPTGLFARDLADCLRLQAAEQGVLTPTMQAVLDHLPLVASGGPLAVARAAGLDAVAVAASLALIRRLNPRPGLAFGGSVAPTRAPDVIVRRSGDGWQVSLNRATLPEVTISAATVTHPALRAARAEAEWLANVVERRNRTVLAVTRAVLTHQQGFLTHGPSALVALSRTTVAARLGLHDSTVGRVARELLVETPHGLRSLCSLFDAGPKAAREGGGPAWAAVRLRLGQLIAAEDPGAPISDAALAALLTREGKILARRTVAKFRDEMGIPPCATRRTPGQRAG
ncbi:RNA polymerase factor sigma-54 [Fuscibacter oryzae]|uniref:RNA polymerase sigma-54 factor n=1 Tax=Fuscibacter oryzae TaxID=2803939 RepID=A0A8J7MUD0_9RHOB|nr:hypothetical protein [Fuscibacter oryzae]MBL4929756.1 hypothetical protein [Fuscibacter oryzae]